MRNYLFFENNCHCSFFYNYGECLLKSVEEHDVYLVLNSIEIGNHKNDSLISFLLLPQKSSYFGSPSFVPREPLIFLSGLRVLEGELIFSSFLEASYVFNFFEFHVIS